MSDLYERDFYAWTGEQAALLRAGRVQTADLEHIAEEIESMGKSQRRELISRLAVLVMHLLKWAAQPEQRSASWCGTINDQRDEIGDLLDDNPSLRPALADLLVKVFPRARRNAATETTLPLRTFPDACPWTPEQVLADGFWPESDGDPG